MHRIKEIKDLKDRLMKIANSAVDCADKVDTEELGDVVDMIKDLAEAEAKCMEAKYYEATICAMEEADFTEFFPPEDLEMMREHHARGYNSHHSARTGRFISNAAAARRASDRSMSRGFPYYPEDGMKMEDPHFEETGEREMPTERFGRPYNEYRRFRRNYTESKSRDDKMAMEKRAQQHVDDTISTIKDIWNTSDPDLRKRMKADFTNLLSEMN